ncbi:hypothetical protein NAI56_11890, partial [Francisella tularensis subsp. holarctica]|uniref:hypothetical protein n=1 Tax=Francisella tularensis TaxID=263 RepID=UPI002381AFF3
IPRLLGIDLGIIPLVYLYKLPLSLKLSPKLSILSIFFNLLFSMFAYFGNVEIVNIGIRYFNDVV